MIYSKAYVVKLERNYIGIWGSGGESPQRPATFQRSIKWKPDIYFLKKKASYLFFLKAYIMKLERNYISIWGSGGDSPQKPATYQRIK